jgi:hypothetical protein
MSSPWHENPVYNNSGDLSFITDLFPTLSLFPDSFDATRISIDATRVACASQSIDERRV